MWMTPQAELLRFQAPPPLLFLIFPPSAAANGQFVSHPFYPRIFPPLPMEIFRKRRDLSPMESFSEVFNIVKSTIHENLSDTAYKLWIEPIQAVDLQDDVVTLMAPTPFHCATLQRNYQTRIQEALNDVLGFEVSIRFVSADHAADQQPAQAEAVIPEPEPAIPAPAPVSEEHIPAVSQTQAPNLPVPDGDYAYTFENFIVGSRNEFAYTACKSIATASLTAAKPYNPLFIYGPSGLGKTHLLMAIKYEVEKRNPGLNIVYTNSENFTNDVIAHIAKKNMEDLRKAYRNADFLLIDDIQFLSGKDQTQEEFFHTFNDLYQHNKQIVITSDRPPKDIQIITDRLKTRFESGLLADISPPDIETRIAIIKRKAELLDLEIPDDIVNFIASKLKSNIRQLEGAVKKLNLNKTLTHEPITLPHAQSVIREILNDEQPLPVTVEKIIEEVGRTFDVSPEDIRSNKRSGPISNARQIAIYIVREITQIPMKQIGQEFGNRDHTTIVYTLKKVQETMKTNPHERGIIEDLIRNIRAK
jgi:chromosomal replication initiator protein